MDIETCRKIVGELHPDEWGKLSSMLESREDRLDFWLTVMREGLLEELWVAHNVLHLRFSEDRHAIEPVFEYLTRPRVKEELANRSEYGVAGWTDRLASTVSSMWEPDDVELLKKIMDRHGGSLPESIVDLIQLALYAFDDAHPMPRDSALKKAVVWWLYRYDKYAQIPNYVAENLPRDKWVSLMREVVTGHDLESVDWKRLHSCLDYITADIAVRAWMYAENNIWAIGRIFSLVERYGNDVFDVLQEIRPQLRERAENSGDRYTDERYTYEASVVVEAMFLARAKKPIPDAYDEIFVEHLTDHTQDYVKPMRTAIAELPHERRVRIILTALDRGEEDFFRGAPAEVAMAVAGKAPTPEVFDALLPEVARCEGHGREAMLMLIAESLAEFGGAAVPKIAEALEGKFMPPGGRAYVKALGLIGTREAIVELVRLTGGRTKAVRDEAERALEALGPAARDALLEGTKARKKAVRTACERLLEKLAVRSDVMGALRKAQKKKDLSEVEQALKEYRECGWTGGKLHVPFVQLTVRMGALAALPVLDYYLEDPSDDKRVSLWIPFIGAFAESEVIAAIAVESLAKTPKIDRWYRDQLVEAVRKQGVMAAREAIRVLATSNPPLRIHLYDMVAEFALKEGKEVFLKGLGDSSKEVRSLCVDALADIGDEVVPEVVKLLQAKKQDTRLAAAEVLTKVAASDHVEVLRRLHAETSDGNLAVLLEKAIEMAGGPRVGADEAASVVEEDELDVEGAVALLEGQKESKLAKWLDPETLPPLKFSDGSPLSARAVKGLLARIKKEGPDGKDRVVWKVRPLLDRGSADAFGWTVFSTWRAAGRPAKDKWAVYQLGALAEARRFDELAPHLDEMARGAERSLALWLVDTMARHGSRRAVSWVAHWARAAERRSLRFRAQEALAAAADEAGLSVAEMSRQLDFFVADEIADRNTPTVGLEQGAIEVSYGKRRFELRLDRGGALVVWDPEAQKKTKSLPKPRKGEEADEAKARYSELKRDVRRVVRQLVGRLEATMISGRTWDADSFRRLFFEHPIFASLGEELVFRADDGISFRLAEGTPVAVDYEEVSISKDATVRLLHRFEMSDEEAAAWGDHLAEAEITQPFAQVGRPIFTHADHPIPTPVGSATRKQVATGIRRIGWRPGAPENAGIVERAYRTFPGRGVRVELRHGGYVVDDWKMGADEEIEVEEVRFADLFGNPLEPESVDPIAYSEVCYDLQRLLA